MAARDANEEIRMKNFEQAIERVVAGMEKKSQVGMSLMTIEVFLKMKYSLEN